MLSLM